MFEYQIMIFGAMSHKTGANLTILHLFWCGKIISMDDQSTFVMKLNQISPTVVISLC